MQPALRLSKRRKQQLLQKLPLKTSLPLQLDTAEAEVEVEGVIMEDLVEEEVDMVEEAAVDTEDQAEEEEVDTGAEAVVA